MENKKINELKLKEKIRLLEGHESWNTYPIKRLNIKGISLTDGPLGVRKKATKKGKGALGLGYAIPSTCFIAPINLAQSFDDELSYQVSSKIAREAKELGVDLLLAPAMNIIRNPRCGRSFEYYSEDPILSGNIAASFVNGLQDNDIYACVKHFALNNCENYRYISDSIVDKRALMEIYLKNFEIVINKSNPKSIMCSYNKYNGIPLSSNKYLLNDILRNKFKYSGLIMTDWGATHDRVVDFKSGVDLDMPGGIRKNRYDLYKYFKKNRNEIDILNKSVSRILELDNINNSKPNNDIFKDNYDTLLSSALDSIVLLKNENNILPLNKNKKYLVIGSLFKSPRYQGAGSSKINPIYLSKLDEVFSKNVSYDYIKGYTIEDKDDEVLYNEAVESASNYENIIFFGGLTEDYESEGFDRDTIKLPNNQKKLIDELSKKTNVVLVLYGGGIMEIPAFERLKGIVYMGLLGGAIGEASYKILFGDYCPNARLSLSWPKDNSKIMYNDTYSNSLIEKYKESIYVGYRWYLNHPDDCRFPLGYGLSYTNFIYRDFKIDYSNKIIKVSMKIKNIGQYDSKEVVLVFIGKNENSKVYKSKKELKAYKKVTIKKQEEVSVTIEINESELAYYNIDLDKWIIENGKYPIYISKDAFNDIYKENIEVNSYNEPKNVYSNDINFMYNNGIEIEDEMFYTITKYKGVKTKSKKFTIETPLFEFKKKFLSRICLKIMISAVRSRKLKHMPDSNEKRELLKNEEFMVKVIPHNTMRSLVQSSGGLVQLSMAYAIVDIANGHILRGLFKMMRRK